jgi:transposase
VLLYSVVGTSNSTAAVFAFSYLATGYMVIEPIINRHNLSAVTGKFLTLLQRKMLHKSLQENIPETYRQRIEIMLLADQGKSQTEICKTLGCSSATARYWIHIARSGMAHLWKDCPMGRPRVVTEEYLEKLKELATHSPRDYGYAFRRWTANWLQKHLTKELGIEISDRHIKQLLKQMGLSTRSHLNHEEKPSDNSKNKISISHLKSDMKPSKPELYDSIHSYFP